MSEKISIYIPVFNAEKTIEQSIHSIKKQSINVNEIIIIDDNSNDNTKEIIDIPFSKKKNLGRRRPLPTAHMVLFVWQVRYETDALKMSLAKIALLPKAKQLQFLRI